MNKNSLFMSVIIALFACATIASCSGDILGGEKYPTRPGTPGSSDSGNNDNNNDNNNPTNPNPDIPPIEDWVEPDADSLAFVGATRTPLAINNAEGFVIRDIIFDAMQTISVIKFSPQDFALRIVLPGGFNKTSDMATSNNGLLAINGTYYNTSTGEPTSLIKIDGSILSHTIQSVYPRVNGLLYIYDNRIEIGQSYDYNNDYVGLIEDCSNVLTCGPVLLDDGERVSYLHITNSESSAKTFFTTHHPRSVIGRDAQDNIYFMVVDGRAEGNAEGMSIDQLTKICAWLKMTEAMNLDGGGSSTLWNYELGIINYPCDNKTFDHNGERKVSNAIIAMDKATM